MDTSVNAETSGERPKDGRTRCNGTALGEQKEGQAKNKNGSGTRLTEQKGAARDGSASGHPNVSNNKDACSEGKAD